MPYQFLNRQGFWTAIFKHSYGKSPSLSSANQHHKCANCSQSVTIYNQRRHSRQDIPGRTLEGFLPCGMVLKLELWSEWTMTQLKDEVFCTKSCTRRPSRPGLAVSAWTWRRGQRGQRPTGQMPMPKWWKNCWGTRELWRNLVDEGW